MAAAEQSPWDMTPAQRPSFESLGANAEGKFVIEEELGDKAPLKDGTMLYKDMVNRCLEAAAIANALVPSLRVIYVWHASSFTVDVGVGLRRIGFDLRQMIVWRKPHFVLSRTHYHYQTEPCWYAVRAGESSRWIGARDQSSSDIEKARKNYEKFLELAPPNDEYVAKVKQILAAE